MGHYLSEMKSDEDWEIERKEREAELQRRTKAIQQKIDEKGLARFLAEVEIGSWSYKISI